MIIDRVLQPRVAHKINMLYIFKICTQKISLKKLFEFRDRGREGETLFCSIYLCIHGFFLYLVCILTGDGTYNLGVLDNALTN